MTICGLPVDGMPGNKTYINKQRYKAVKNDNCIHTADSYDFDVVVAETTNTIGFHSGSQVRQFFSKRSESENPTTPKLERFCLN